jgi:hypothetical protein
VTLAKEQEAVTTEILGRVGGSPGEDHTPHHLRLALVEDESRLRRRTGIRARDSNASGLPTRTLDELLADSTLPTDVEWLVEGLIPRGGMTVVYGIGKGGKTTLLSHLAAAIVSGREFLDRSVREGPVLWLDLEQHVTLTRRKLDEAGAAGCSNPLHVYNGPAPRTDEVARELAKRGAVAVVIDSLSKYLCLKDENDAAEVTARLGPLLDLAHGANAAVIAIHHDRKSDGALGRNMRGSSAFLAAVDVAIGVKREAGDEFRRRLDCVSRYDEVDEEISVRLTPSGYVSEQSSPALRHSTIP